MQNCCHNWLTSFLSQLTEVESSRTSLASRTGAQPGFGKGGAFLKEWEKCKRPWPEFSLFLKQNHTVCLKIETEFLGKLGNSNVFAAQKQVVSKKKKKKKKGLHRPKLRLHRQKFKRFFSPKTVGLQKKVFTEIETDFSAKIGNSNAFSGRITTCTSQLRHPISFGGGCFQFFTKNRPQKHQKRSILHTLKPLGGARAPAPLATLLLEDTFWSPWSWPQVLKNCPVFFSRKTLFFESLKFCSKTSETSRKIC